MIAPNWNDMAAYRAWLQSGEYRANMRKLLGEQPTPTRTDYRPVDPESIGAIRDRAKWHSQEAARLFKRADELREAMGVLK